MTSSASAPRPGYGGAVAAAVEVARQELESISLDIHAHPELGNQERHAAEILTGFLERHGFQVQRGVAGLDTAFIATAVGGAGDGPTVAILAEYDALPGLGHGCGHNLIALTAIGGGLGAKAALGPLPGRILVMGTPAEETEGAKVRFLEEGLFDDVDVALSSHPSSNRTTVLTDVPVGESLSIALVGYHYAFHGKAAHAAATPHEGINALNAVIHLFTGIDALRQHVRDDARIHGIITDGGKAPNVVPDYAAAEFFLRARDRNYLLEIAEKVRRVAEGAASMTGARLEILPGDPLYENVVPNSPLARAARANAQAVGLHLDEPPPGRRGSGASTDFGNVSQRVPAFAMHFAISETPIPGHSVEVAQAACSKLGLDNAVAVAKVLALTACDVLRDPRLLADARADFAARTRAQQAAG